MDYSIRPLKEVDLALLQDIEKACYPEPWSENQFRQELQLPCSRIDLCWVGERLAGYHCYWLVAGEMQIMNLATSPEFQRRGIARRLLHHALDVASKQGVTRTYLEVRVGNLAAINLYRSCGFVDDGVRAHYYADGEDALLMVKRFCS